MRCAGAVGHAATRRSAAARPGAGWRWRVLGVSEKSMPPITSADGPVAVTGASGYVGAQIVLNLVDHGYTVRCCVRDANNPQKTAHLLAMNSYGAPGKVTLHTADLLTPGDYDAVFAGCSAVFHVAAVLERDHQGGGQGSGDGVTQRQVYDGGFLATQNVIASVKKSGSVRRIIYTSSVAGVVGGRPVDHVYTEADWADHGDLSGPKNELPFGYGRSKADTERLLYSEAAADGSFDVISHNPWVRLTGTFSLATHFTIQI